MLGVPLAWATARTDMPFRRTVQALAALAYITPPYLTAIAYIILLGPEAGYLNRPIQALTGITRGPANIFSMAGVIFVIGMHVFPFTYFMTHNALRSVDASFEEAARLLGARRWAVLRRVYLPLVAPAITGGALLSAIASMALFGPQALLGMPAQITFLPDPHLRRDRRLSAALGGRVRAVADACGAHRPRPRPPARLSRAAILRHDQRPWPQARNPQPGRLEMGRCWRSARSSPSSAP